MADMRLIDANALRVVLKNEECDCEVFPWAVDNAPTVDAVPVVRCRDCRKCSFRNDVITRQKEYICLLTRDHREVEADDFCSAGERKEN